MTEDDIGPTFADYESTSKRANDLYKEAESLVGVNEYLFIEKLSACATLEEAVFYMSGGVGVGNLIRDTHARYAIQNYFRAGLYNDVIRFGRRAEEIILEAGSEGTVSQLEQYRKAAEGVIMKDQPQP